MYSNTSINWPCSNAETLLRRTDTFDPVCFLYASLSRIYKAIEIYCYSKNRKDVNSSDGRLLFSPQIKQPPALTRKHVKILGISEKQMIKLDLSVNFLKKKLLLLRFKATSFFCLILQFWRSAVLLTRTLNRFLQVTLCNQPTVVLHHWRRDRAGTFKPCSTPL